MVDVGDGVRVGYLRAVFVAAAGSLDAAFDAFDAEEPIVVKISGRTEAIMIIATRGGQVKIWN